MKHRIKVAIFTTTRADFGILSSLIHCMEKDDIIEPMIFAGGTHLSEEHDHTLREIQELGFQINGTFDYLLNEDTSFSIAKSMGIACIELAHLFDKNHFDFVCLLGDRYELLAIAAIAIIFKKPIIHLYGGEATEGVIDEQIRHMITKAAHLHITACEEYAANIRKMGEPEWRIFNCGALGIDNIVKMEKMSLGDIAEEIRYDPNAPFALMTYHPVTLEFHVPLKKQLENLFTALEDFSGQLLITAPNMEVGRETVESVLIEKARDNRKIFFVKSLGVRKYLSLVRHCEFVIGNSSSGMVEAPFFRIPTVNVGDRQKGRIRHESIIDTDYTVASIRKGIKKALSKSFKTKLEQMEFKFGNGHAAEKMVEIIKSTNIDQKLLRKRLDFQDTKRQKPKTQHIDKPI